MQQKADRMNKAGATVYVEYQELNDKGLWETTPEEVLKHEAIDKARDAARVEPIAAQLHWCDRATAETWPEGIHVLERRVIDGETSYEADNYFRPDWLAEKSRRHGQWSWAKLSE